MRILVTGGAGFVGKNLVQDLVASGHSVSVIDDFSTGLRSNVADLDVEVIEGKVQDSALVRSTMQGHDSVVHLAARGSVPRSIRFPKETHAANVEGTLSVLDAARSTGAHVIFSSSSSVYGATALSPKTEQLPIAPMSPYAASKASAEAYVSAYASSYALEAITFRFFNVFGPWQRPDHVYAAVIPKWIWAALHGQDLIVNGDSMITRDFTFVDDVVKVLRIAVDQRVSSPTPVNLAFGHPISLDQVLTYLRTTLGRFGVLKGPARPGDILHSANDPGRLLSLFPGAESTPFEVGLKKTIDWLSREGYRVAGIALED